MHPDGQQARQHPELIPEGPSARQQSRAQDRARVLKFAAPIEGIAFSYQFAPCQLLNAFSTEMAGDVGVTLQEGLFSL
jgi:hypothetical protein